MAEINIRPGCGDVALLAAKAGRKVIVRHPGRGFTVMARGT